MRILSIEFALRTRKKLSTILQSQFNCHTLPVTPFYATIKNTVLEEGCPDMASLHPTSLNLFIWRRKKPPICGETNLQILLLEEDEFLQVSGDEPPTLIRARRQERRRLKEENIQILIYLEPQSLENSPNQGVNP